MNIILCGACGRMGRNITEAVKQVENAKIVCGVDLFPAPMPYPVYTSIRDIHEVADVVIDFSSKTVLRDHLEYCKQRSIPIVVATTGLTDSDYQMLNEAAEVIPVFQTGNFSLGVNLLQILVKKAAEILGDDFDAEIIERHHNQKKDAPSGTAMMLAESVNAGYEHGKHFVYGRHGMVGAREKEEIAIHAVRGGTIVGEHEVMFAGQDEIITLSHSARSRMVFATGSIKAAAWLVNQPAGKYDMSNMLGEMLSK